MPNENPSDKLEWSADNLTTVLTRLYARAQADRTFRDRLMADPATVVGELIEIPDEYRGKVLAQNRTDKILVLNVPSYGETTESLEQTTTADETPDYLICTTDTEW